MAEESTIVHAIISFVVLGIIIFGFFKLLSTEKEGFSKESLECTFLFFLPNLGCESDQQQVKLPDASLQALQEDRKFLDNFVDIFDKCLKGIECKCNLNFEKLFDRDFAYPTLIINKIGDNVEISLRGTEKRVIKNIDSILINKYSLPQQRQNFNPIDKDPDFLLGTDKVIISKEADFLQVVFKNTKTGETKIIWDKDIIMHHSTLRYSPKQASSFISSRIGISQTSNNNLLLYIPNDVIYGAGIFTELNPLPQCLDIPGLPTYDINVRCKSCGVGKGVCTESACQDLANRKGVPCHYADYWGYVSPGGTCKDISFWRSYELAPNN